MDVKVGNIVTTIDNPHSAPCEVMAVDDLGHGEGSERVTIRLLPPWPPLTRYYATCELLVVRDG